MVSKGQTSTEFVILLGVVLLIALVAVGLSVFFVQSSKDISQSEINAYWSTQATPLRIVDMEGYYYSGTPALGEVAIMLENIDTKPITVKSFVIEPYGGENTFNVYANHSIDGTTGGLALLGTAGPSAPQGLSSQLAPSQRMVFYLRTGAACADAGIAKAGTGKFYSDFTIYYDTPYFTGLSFKGVKPIAGECNPS